MDPFCTRNISTVHTSSPPRVGAVNQIRRVLPVGSVRNFGLLWNVAVR